MPRTVTDAKETDAADHPHPRGTLTLRIPAQPRDTNSAGDIFGGWIMGLMDMAAGYAAFELAQGRIVTAAVSDLSFLKPVKVGDMVACYTELVRRGRTSLTLDVDVWVRRGMPPADFRVTQARFVMVAVDQDGRPRPLPAT